MRRLLTLVCVVVFTDTMLFGALIPLLPGYADEFGLSKLEAGLLLGAFGGGAIVGAIPGGILAARIGPRRAVAGGLVLLGVASIAFALSGSPLTLGLSRFVQGASSGLTWAGALAWITTTAPRDRRGAMLGTAFGFAVFGAILGPLVGALAAEVSVRGSFAGVGVVAFVLAGVAWAERATPPETHVAGSLGRALRDGAFGAGLWLNLLPAFFFGVLEVLVPLRLADAGWTALAIGLVFFGAGALETVLNPIVGRVSDRRGRLYPIRIALAASALVAVALAAATAAPVVAALTVFAALSFGGFYTPGMALVSDRAEVVGLTQGLGFGVMNTAWAAGALSGPTIGGAAADRFGDAVPYLLCAGLSFATLLVVLAAGRRVVRTA
jgi:MFS family permease